MAGAPGFEPGNGGTKNRCLTTWRRPNCGGVYSSRRGAARGNRRLSAGERGLCRARPEPVRDGAAGRPESPVRPADAGRHERPLRPRTWPGGPVGERPGQARKLWRIRRIRSPGPRHRADGARGRWGVRAEGHPPGGRRACEPHGRVFLLPSGRAQRACGRVMARRSARRALWARDDGVPPPEARPSGGGEGAFQPALQPVDVVMAGDDVLLLQQRGEERHGGVHPVNDQLAKCAV